MIKASNAASKWREHYYSWFDRSIDDLYAMTIILDPDLPFQSKDTKCRQYHTRQQDYNDVLEDEKSFKFQMDEKCIYNGENYQCWQGKLDQAFSY